MVEAILVGPAVQDRGDVRDALCGIATDIGERRQVEAGHKRVERCPAHENEARKVLGLMLEWRLCEGCRTTCRVEGCPEMWRSWVVVGTRRMYLCWEHARVTRSMVRRY